MNEPKTKLMVGVLGLLAVISFVSAEAITKLSNSVNQNQVAQVSRTSTATSSTTPTITRTSDTVATTSPTYKRGDSSPIIKEVQQDLTDQGIYKGLISGQLGPRTEAAIKEFQTKNGLPATGILDNITIKLFEQKKKLCTPNSTPWIKVVSPNGGEVYQEGQEVEVKWESCNVPSDVEVGITLKNLISPNTYSNHTLIEQTPNDESHLVTLSSQSGLPPFVFGTNFKIELSYVVVSGGPTGEIYPMPNWLLNGGDDSDDLFTIGDGPVNANTSCKIMLIPEETSPDFISSSITNTDQSIARFWLYSTCGVKITSLSTQPFGTYSVPSEEGINPNYTFWGANRFKSFSAYTGWNQINQGALLGSVVYNGIGSSSQIHFTQPLVLSAGVPRAISITGSLKPLNQVSGIISDKGQFCIEAPMATDMNGNSIPFNAPAQPSGDGFATFGNLFGRFSCGDIFRIE